MYKLMTQTKLFSTKWRAFRKREKKVETLIRLPNFNRKKQLKIRKNNKGVM